jgi:hypothetical protein
MGTLARWGLTIDRSIVGSASSEGAFFRPVADYIEDDKISVAINCNIVYPRISLQ